MDNCPYCGINEYSQNCNGCETYTCDNCGEEWHDDHQGHDVSCEAFKEFEDEELKNIVNDWYKSNFEEYEVSETTPEWRESLSNNSNDSNDSN